MDSFTTVSGHPTREGLPLARSTGPFASRRAIIVTAILLGAWLAVVIFTASRHEFWRDEVRAFTLARAASSPFDIYGLIQHDGHPILWYLILHVGTSLVDTPLVLPVTSIVIAFAAVVLFLLAAPFPLWIRGLFIFSALPVYEYSVMARNYGISMLLMFVAAVLYRTRAQHPVLLALALALLANTNAHSAVLACLIAGFWAWDLVVDERTRSRSVRAQAMSLFPAFGMIGAGVLLCFIFTMPSEDTIVTSVRESAGLQTLASGFVSALLRPDETFPVLLPGSLPSVLAVVVFYLAAFGLASRPNLLLAALGAQIAFGMLFRVVYAGSYRHQGLYLLFLLVLYWIYVESSNRRTVAKPGRLLFNAGLCAMVILIVANVARSPGAVWSDITMARSSSRAFGEFLRGSEIYADAILVPEPDLLLESLPYYANNPIYLSREHRFGTTVSFTTRSHYRLTLGELLANAREIRAREGRPVLIVLGRWDLDRHSPGEKKYIFNKVFAWTHDELAEFKASTTLVAEFKSSYGDENYRVYAVD